MNVRNENERDYTELQRQALPHRVAGKQTKEVSLALIADRENTTSYLKELSDYTLREYNRADRLRFNAKLKRIFMDQSTTAEYYSDAKQGGLELLRKEELSAAAITESMNRAGDRGLAITLKEDVDRLKRKVRVKQIVASLGVGAAVGFGVGSYVYNVLNTTESTHQATNYDEASDSLPELRQSHSTAQLAYVAANGIATFGLAGMLTSVITAPTLVRHQARREIANLPTKQQ